MSEPLPPSTSPSAITEVPEGSVAAPFKVRWSVLASLSAMMFLQFGALGLWVVTAGTYIGENTGSAGSGMFDASFVGIAGMSGALGAIFAPLLFGAMADSWFRTEQLMAVLNVGCAAMLVLMQFATEQWSFFAWMVLYFQFCVPAITLCNSLGLRHLMPSKAAFTIARAIGTSGWIVALVVVGSLVPWMLNVSSMEVEASTRPMAYAVGAHLAMALFSLYLPHTPPLAKGVTWRSLLGGCVALVRGQPRLVLFLIASYFAMIAPQVYNMFGNLFLNKLGIKAAASVMSLGQVAEVVCLLVLPWLLWRWGPKRVFAIGLVAWIARYILLSFGGATGWPLVAIYGAILLHGACYAFVYATGFYYVDHASPPETRSAAQGLLAVVTVGFGHLTGSVFAGVMQARFLTPPGVLPEPYEWRPFFLMAGGAGLIALLLLWLLMGFHREEMAEYS